MALNLKPACPTCTQTMLQSKSTGMVGNTLPLVKWFCHHCNAWKTVTPEQDVKLRKGN
jgi:transposase-like protein